MRLSKAEVLAAVGLGMIAAAWLCLLVYLWCVAGWQTAVPLTCSWLAVTGLVTCKAAIETQDREEEFHDSAF